jgi:hypothetical protein
MDGVFEPRTLQVPDPRLDQVIQALSGLTSRVAQLANQVEELKRPARAKVRVLPMRGWVVLRSSARCWPR